MAGGCPVEGPLEVHRNILVGHRGGERGEGRALWQELDPLSGTSVALSTVGDYGCRHTHPGVLPSHRRIHAGFFTVSRQGRVILENEYRPV